MSGSETSNALYDLTKQITEKLENSDKCIAVFLDLAKAFDTVSHDRRLNVLFKYGVRGKVLNIFKTTYWIENNI